MGSYKTNISKQMYDCIDKFPMSVCDHRWGLFIHMCWLALTRFDLARKPSAVGICISITTGLPA